MSTYHVVPINDGKEHLHESTCWCEPSAEIIDNGNLLLVHGAYDGRLIIEDVIENIPGIEKAEGTGWEVYIHD